MNDSLSPRRIHPMSLAAGRRGSASALVLAAVVVLIVTSVLFTMSRTADATVATVQRAMLARVAHSLARSAVDEAACSVQNHMNVNAASAAERYVPPSPLVPLQTRALAVSGVTADVSDVTVRVDVDPSGRPFGLVTFHVVVTLEDALGTSLTRTFDRPVVFLPQGPLPATMDALVTVDTASTL